MHGIQKGIKTVKLCLEPYQLLEVHLNDASIKLFVPKIVNYIDLNSTTFFQVLIVGVRP